MQGERKLQNYILDYLKFKYSKSALIIKLDNKGSYDPIKQCFRKNTKHTSPGLPDILIIFNGGKAIFLEVKTNTGRLSQNQKQFSLTCVAKDIKYHVVRSIIDCETIMAAETKKHLVFPPVHFGSKRPPIN